MKPTLQYLTLIAALAALFVGTGCNTITTNTTQYVGVAKFPPSDPAKVEVLRTEPTRPHTRLGEVRAEPPSTSTDVVKIEAALRQNAAKLGADAVVVVLDRVQVTGAYVVGRWYDRSVESIKGRVVVAVAIKYQ